MASGAILMDLSKAFDFLAHDFTIEKLSAYGLSDAACSFLHGYLSDRKQIVKLGQHHTLRLNTNKGVPQGSILGSIHFNTLYFHKRYLFLCQTVHLYNYADDKKMQKYKKILFLTAVGTFLRPRLWLRLRVKTPFSGLPSITCKQTLKSFWP